MNAVTPFDDSGAMPVAWAAKIIERLQVLYGARFSQQWADLDPAKMAPQWAAALGDLSGDEIAKGLVACRSRDWPPTIPEFIKLCRPQVQPEAAFHEAVAGMVARQRGEVGEWSHPGIYWAAVRVSQHDMLSHGYSAIKGRWEAALRDVMSKGKWQDVPEPALALAAPGRTTTSDAEARQQLARLNAAVADAVKPMPNHARNRDLRWAYRILEQDKQPSGRPPAINVRMAETALRNAGEVPHG